MALSDDRIFEIAEAYGTLDSEYRRAEFARTVEAEARRDALEEAAAAVEKATYRKRWAKAAVNSHPDDVPPCEFAALIRAMKKGAPFISPEESHP